MFKYLTCKYGMDKKNPITIKIIDEELSFIDEVTKCVEKLNKEETQIWVTNFSKYIKDMYGDDEDVVEDYTRYMDVDYIDLHIVFNNQDIELNCFTDSLIYIFLDINLFKNTPFSLDISEFEERISVDLFKGTITITSLVGNMITKTYESSYDVVELMKKINYKKNNTDYGDYYEVSIKYLNKVIYEQFEYLNTESNTLLKLIKDVITSLEEENGRSMLDYFDINDVNIDESDLINVEAKEYYVASVKIYRFGKVYSYLCDETFEVGEIALTTKDKKVKIVEINKRFENELPLPFNEMKSLKKLSNNIKLKKQYLVASVTFYSYGKKYDYFCDETFEVGEIALTDKDKKVKIVEISKKYEDELIWQPQYMKSIKKYEGINEIDDDLYYDEYKYHVASVTFELGGEIHKYLCDETFMVNEKAVTDEGVEVTIHEIELFTIEELTLTELLKMDFLYKKDEVSIEDFDEEEFWKW